MKKLFNDHPVLFVITVLALLVIGVAIVSGGGNVIWLIFGGNNTFYNNGSPIADQVPNYTDYTAISELSTFNPNYDDERSSRRWSSSHCDTTYIATTGDVNVRDGPGLDYAQKGMLAKNSTVQYLDRTSIDSRRVAWYKVSTRFGEGWISSKYSTFL